MRKSLLAFVAAMAMVAAATPAMASAGTAGLYGPKGNPSGAMAGTRSISALTFLYGGTYQFAVADGTSAVMTVARPTLATGDFHSLGEAAVSSADSQQVVEVGWTVDRGLFGDANPHLFVFHWVNGVATCYNGCGFVAASTIVTAGMTLPVGGTPQFSIQHFQGNWWVGYGGTWFGFFPDALWSGGYTKAGLIQWFGEVAANSASPCTDMGNALFPASTSSATAFGITYFGGPAVSIILNTVTNPSLYGGTRTSANSMRFGGPGAC
jgi:neprosin-like protein